MTPLSIDSLNALLPSADLEAALMTLAQWPAEVTTQWKERRALAMHEAAHFAAACACPGAYISSVYISPNGKPSKRFMREAAGHVRSLEKYAAETLFVTQAGIQWEGLTGGDGDYSDIARAERESREVENPAAVEAACRVFVTDHSRLINVLGVAILLAVRTDGSLGHKKLDQLVKWTRQQVRPFRWQELANLD